MPVQSCLLIRGRQDSEKFLCKLPTPPFTNWTLLNSGSTWEYFRIISPPNWTNGPGESLGCFGHPKHPKDDPTHLQCVAHSVAGRWLPPPAFWKASAEKFPWRNEVFVYRIPMHDPKWWFSYFLLKIWDSRAFWISIVYCRVVSWAIPKLRSRRCSRDYIVGRWQWMWEM